eukprot:TRINITY_DN3502_c0_g1_i7.p1 TRINITY_DN3502_c0_g1~~TRINITY_DN3502_c0_g1_i7.p1  ORF type:complete len:851 (-),score=279.90 TRINITY_DN3502_c0_g1_i7:275-2503(-)
MCAASEVSIITANVQVIIDHGLGDKNKDDYLLAQHSCNALLKIVPSKLKQDDPDAPPKFKPDHALFLKLEELIVSGLTNKDNRDYMPMARSAMRVIYQLGEGPDQLMEVIIRKIVAAVNDKLPEMGEGKIEAHILQRLCFLVGEISLNQLNYLDVNVYTELKRRNYLREAKAEKEKRKAAEKKQKRQSMMRATALSTPMNATTTGAEDDDMGIVGAEADDAEAEFIQQVTEKEILTGDSMLAQFEPLLVAICSNHAKFPDKDTRCAAALALCKFMLMSSDFANKHLRLVFTMLEKEKEPTIRANLIIALGDLSVRFPNNVEPWTPKMYARLHDGSYKVRYNTLTILTHLIFNDMIKVKGQISDIAFCIVDKEDKISMRSKLFFSELAKKGNTLYNVMPDIVSRLSDPEVGVKEEDFRVVMKYIIGLIEKDKLLESLVEKLCHRFRATRTKRQWRDIAFCLSLFPYSDKGFKKLAENFGCWGDKLHEDQVYESFLAIFGGIKKGVGRGPVGGGNREAFKQLVEELEAKVEEARSKGVEDDTADRRAREAREGKKGKKDRKGRRGEHDSDSSDMEDFQPEDDNASHRRETRKSKQFTQPTEDTSPEKRLAPTPSKKPSENEDNESEDEEEEEQSPEKPRKSSRRGGAEEQSPEKPKKSSRHHHQQPEEPEKSRKGSSRRVIASDTEEQEQTPEKSRSSGRSRRQEEVVQSSEKSRKTASRSSRHNDSENERSRGDRERSSRRNR